MRTKLYEMLSYYQTIDKKLRESIKDSYYTKTMDIMKEAFEANHAVFTQLVEKMEADEALKVAKIRAERKRKITDEPASNSEN